MHTVETVNTAAGALAAGLATSLHCAGMCGPVACSLMGLKAAPQQQQQAAALYHGGRVFSYTTLGVIAGAIGYWPLAQITRSPVMVLPWILAVVLLFMALGFRLHLPKPLFLRKWSARTRLKLCRIPVRRGAFALGLATPLLPCGPLYLMTGIALASGSAVKGAEFMMAFSMGTIPLLWFAQHRFHVWRQQLGAVAMDRVKRGICLVASLMLIVRIWPAPSSLASSGDAASAPSCPFCETETK
jgi:sulfite exporter TauE/SafE